MGHPSPRATTLPSRLEGAGKQATPLSPRPARATTLPHRMRGASSGLYIFPTSPIPVLKRNMILGWCIDSRAVL